MNARIIHYAYTFRLVYTTTSGWLMQSTAKQPNGIERQNNEQMPKSFMCKMVKQWTNILYMYTLIHR